MNTFQNWSMAGDAIDARGSWRRKYRMYKQMWMPASPSVLRVRMLGAQNSKLRCIITSCLSWPRQEPGGCSFIKRVSVMAEIPTLETLLCKVALVKFVVAGLPHKSKKGRNTEYSRRRAQSWSWEILMQAIRLDGLRTITRQRRRILESFWPNANDDGEEWRST